MNDKHPVIITTDDAADILKMTPAALRTYLYRYPDLRPGRRISGDDLLWSPEDVERVAEVRANRGRRKTE